MRRWNFQTFAAMALGGGALGGDGGDGPGRHADACCGNESATGWGSAATKMAQLAGYAPLGKPPGFTG